MAQSSVLPTAGISPTATTVTESRKISLQEREVHRYYQPWLSAHGSALNVANHVESIAKLDLHGQGYKPKSSKDKALTAFAHLAALRLNVKTAMVSLIDANNQMILAEATKGASVNSTDDLWLGSTILSRPDAVCEHCFYNSYTARDEIDGRKYTAKGLVVDDCRLDKRFADRPYVKSEPGVRFYAGVPIITRNGMMIGAYAVSDEKPRDGLSVEELKFMQETSIAVMEHLEWARDRVDRFKGDRIVRGMAAFIEGCTSMQGDPEAERGADSRPVSRGQENGGVPQPISGAASTRVPRRIEGLTHGDSKTARDTSLSPPADSRPRLKRTKTATKPKSDSSSMVFARAAENLRESTIADGAAIFGASAGGSGDIVRAQRKNLPRAAAGQPSASNGVASSNSTAQTYVLPSPGSESSTHDIGTSDSDSSPMARPCKILAFSIADDEARADIEQGPALTLGTLERYFTLYPKGKVFSFTDNGSGVSSEDEGSASERESRLAAGGGARSGGEGGNEPRSPPPRRRGTRNRRMDHKELLKKIPGAKSVVFLPLYDFTEEKLMAGCFLWTSVTGRMMNLDDDLSYLRAFGNSIMSEVARMNVAKNEAAKTTFIASMSHELRSPLHGILGAAEFLVDTAADSYQAGLITSIATCGKTLLDTLNHVLDYSKINKLGRAQMRRNAKQNKLVKLDSDAGLESINMTAEVDLGVLVEEVVEAVTAGHQFKKLHGSVLATKAGSSTLANGIASLNGVSGSNDVAAAGVVGAAGQRAAAEGPVSVLLDISPRRSWTVRTQPGALRRIIMNLLGNALKYTSSGFVAVSLRAQDNASSTKVNALIRVVDSGKGMSEDFQRNRLFVPFSQEDSFQPGTGLGLSIVKQIVDSLGGSVEVKSQVGMGTEIDIHVNLIPAASSAGGEHEIPKDDIAIATAQLTRGMKLVLLDPCVSDGKPRAITNQIARLEETLAEVCREWFEMDVQKSSDVEHPEADLFLYSEPPPVEHLVRNFGKGRRKSAKGRERPIIIVCPTAEEAVEVGRNHGKAMAEQGAILEVIPQPCGPRKFAKVLAHCLRRAEEAAARDTPQAVEGKEEVVVRVEEPPPSPSATKEVKRRSLKVTRPANERHDASQNVPLSAAVSFPSPPPLDPATPSLEGQVRSPAPAAETGTSVQHQRPSTASSTGATAEPLHVLLVDDNKINLQLLTMFMKKHAFTYSEAENGQLALDLYKSSCLPGPHTDTDTPVRKFDFVLMDISMPVMNGMEATKRIREFEKENGVRGAMVIALTGLASKEAQREAESVGVDVFLPKPVRFAELKKLLVAR